MSNDGMDKQRPYHNEAWLYLEYVIKGCTLRDIAEPYGITYQRIGQLVKLFGLTEKRNALRKPYTNKEWLAREFVDKRRIRQDIADECGVKKGTIGVWVAKHKLERKSFTKEERNQRSVARHIRLYATDPEFRRTNIENAIRWQQENPERAKKHQWDYRKRKKMKEEAS